MPGETIPPNKNAADTMAFGMNVIGPANAVINQYPTDSASNHVTQFYRTRTGTNLSILWDEDFMPDS